MLACSTLRISVLAAASLALRSILYLCFRSRLAHLLRSRARCYVFLCLLRRPSSAGHGSLASIAAPVLYVCFRSRLAHLLRSQLAQLVMSCTCVFGADWRSRLAQVFKTSEPPRQSKSCWHICTWAWECPFDHFPTLCGMFWEPSLERDREGYDNIDNVYMAVSA